MQFRHAGKCGVRLGYAPDTLNKRYKGVSNIYRTSRTRLGHISVQSVRQVPKPMSRKIKNAHVSYIDVPAFSALVT